MKTRNKIEFRSALTCVAIALFIASLTACDQGASPNADNSDGYYAGYDLGIKLAELRQQYPGIELDEAFKGMLDALSDTSQQAIRTELCARLQPAEAKPAEAEYAPASSVQLPETEQRPHNISKFEFTKDDFAALNARRDGVVTLPSGVQYEVLKAGSGEPPEAGDAVVISYEASFADGTVMGTTDDSEPQYIALDDIAVPGLKEALLLMNTGARWQVVVPPGMGFTKSGNRTLRRRDLIYDIMLVSIDRALPVEASQ